MCCCKCAAILISMMGIEILPTALGIQLVQFWSIFLWHFIHCDTFLIKWFQVASGTSGILIVPLEGH